MFGAHVGVPKSDCADDIADGSQAGPAHSLDGASLNELFAVLIGVADWLTGAATARDVVCMRLGVPLKASDADVVAALDRRCELMGRVVDHDLVPFGRAGQPSSLDDPKRLRLLAKLCHRSVG